MLITMASHHLPSHGDLDERCPEFFPGAEVDDGMRLWGVHVDELRHSIEQYGAVNHHRKEPALMTPCNKRNSGRAGPLTRLRDIVHQVVHMARIATHENPWNLRLAILVHHWSFGHRIHGHTQRLADLVLWNKADRQDDAVTAQPFFRSRNRAHLLIDRRRFHGFDAVVPENAGHGSRQMQWNTKIVQTLRDIARETRRCRLGFKNAQHFSPLQREPACHDEPDVATAQDNNLSVQFRYAAAVDKHQNVFFAVPPMRLSHECGRQNWQTGLTDHMNEAPGIFRSRQLFSKPQQTETVMHALLEDTSKMVLPLYQNGVRPPLCSGQRGSHTRRSCPQHGDVDVAYHHDALRTDLVSAARMNESPPFLVMAASCSPFFSPIIRST